MTPLVSIVIPCFNAERWLAATLESALAQTWPATEIIVVDDGSRDGSLALARSFAARGVNILAQANAGASAARNTGLRAARGEWIQFLDADDLLAPDKIEQQLRRLASAPSTTLFSGAWARFQTSPALAVFQPEPNWRDLMAIEFLRLHFEEGWMMHPAAWLARRSLLAQAGPWNETVSLNDDGEYFARVMLAAGRIVFCGEARSYYRSGNRASLSARLDRRALESLYRVAELTLSRLLAAEDSPRTRAAAAAGWKWTAFELYPGAPDLSLQAEQHARALGGSARQLPAGKKFQLASRVLGWRLAKRLFC